MFLFLWSKIADPSCNIVVGEKSKVPRGVVALKKGGRNMGASCSISIEATEERSLMADRKLCDCGYGDDNVVAEGG